MPVAKQYAFHSPDGAPSCMGALLLPFKYCVITSVENVLSKRHPVSLQNGVLDSASLKS